MLFKGAVLYEELVNILLLVRPPGGLTTPHRTRELVSHVDLVPTIVEWCGGTVPEKIQGTDIRNLCEGGDDPVRNGLAFEFHSSNWGETPEPMRGWRTADWKLVSTLRGDEELYNLTEDPWKPAIWSTIRDRIQSGNSWLRTWTTGSDRFPMHGRRYPCPSARSCADESALV